MSTRSSITHSPGSWLPDPNMVNAMCVPRVIKSGQTVRNATFMKPRHYAVPSSLPLPCQACLRSRRFSHISVTLFLQPARKNVRDRWRRAMSNVVGRCPKCVSSPVRVGRRRIDFGLLDRSRISRSLWLSGLVGGWVVRCAHRSPRG